MKKLTFCLLTILSSTCFAERPIAPVQLEFQNEIFVQGATVIQSRKSTELTLFQTVDSIEGGKANFYFHFCNPTHQPINLIFSNLKASDQFGRPIRVVHKQEIISQKKQNASWGILASGLLGGVDSYNAQRAGDINYASHTSSNLYGNTNTYSSNGVSATGNIRAHGSSTTYGTIRSEGLRRQAVRQANVDTAVRNNAIMYQYAQEKCKLENFYFDSTTVFPGEQYESGFQLELTRGIEQDIEYLYITFDVGQESHTFCFYCHPEPRKWYQFNR